MEIKTEITIKVTLKEAQLLRDVLGNQTGKDYEGNGLDKDTGNNLHTELCNELKV